MYQQHARAMTPFCLTRSTMSHLLVAVKTCFDAYSASTDDRKFVLTAYVSSWEKTKDWLFTGQPDGVCLQCLQETRLLDCVTVQAKRHAEAAGWTAVMAPAVPGGASHRRTCDFGEIPPSIVPARSNLQNFGARWELFSPPLAMAGGSSKGIST